jgi:hypothetical protein
MQKKLQFIIRDDDLNYFSTPEDVEKWYADIFSQNIPVGFAAIPFVNPSSDVYPFLDPHTAPKVEDKEFPIRGNVELVEYVKGNPLIEILQHGTTHETKLENGKAIFEYQGRVPLHEARRGREELEQAFGVPVTIFVPPHDWIGTSGIFSIEEAHEDVIRGRGAGLRNFIIRWSYFIIFIRMLWHKISHFGMKKVPAYPHVLNFGRHKELCSYRLEDADIFNGLEYAHKKSGIFVVVVHVHTLNSEKKERLNSLIRRAQELSAEFVKPSSVF